MRGERPLVVVREIGGERVAEQQVVPALDGLVDRRPGRRCPLISNMAERRVPLRS
ncbi:hypothetical protein [Cellulosimicrobium arenosum]|uniref:Uncharacterized protein n=1 Tax=Cellulosimicrobium arenosum TaxID=2708133 RepID=A0A927J0J1_9MICO|nr:hypothetical protein [Cellulosimicrobium arenosum]MBD8079643.1 hypothetical protein [Cellulosimicrobium arenosum]